MVHHSQAETLGVSLNHKSNLVPSGSIGHPNHIVSWPLRGDGDKYTLRSGNQQPTKSLLLNKTFIAD